MSGDPGRTPDHPPSTPTRRGLLGAAAALSAAGAAAVVPIGASAATSTAEVNAGAWCTKTGACPCDDPCIWGKQVIEDIQRDGWPMDPDAELLALASRHADTPDEVFVPWDHSLREAKLRAMDLMSIAVGGLLAKAEIITAGMDFYRIDSPEEGGLADLAASLARDVVAHVLGRV